MYSKEGWACPPFLSYIFWLFFFSRAKNYCKEFVLILFVYQAFEKEYSGLKNTQPEHTEKDKLG